MERRYFTTNLIDRNAIQRLKRMGQTEIFMAINEINLQIKTTYQRGRYFYSRICNVRTYYRQLHQFHQ